MFIEIELDMEAVGTTIVYSELYMLGLLLGWW